MTKLSKFCQNLNIFPNEFRADNVKYYLHRKDTMPDERPWGRGTRIIEKPAHCYRQIKYKDMSEAIYKNKYFMYGSTLNIKDWHIGVHKYPEIPWEIYICDDSKDYFWLRVEMGDIEVV